MEVEGTMGPARSNGRTADSSARGWSHSVGM